MNNSNEVLNLLKLDKLINSGNDIYKVLRYAIPKPYSKYKYKSKKKLFVNNCIYEDIVQDCAEAVLRYNRNYDPTLGSVFTWVWWQCRGTIGKKSIRYLHDVKPPICKIQKEKYLNVEERSIDGDDINDWEADLIERTITDPFSKLCAKDWHFIYNIFLELSKREQDILYRRFFEDETLEEIGLSYDVSRERIRQLELKALTTLKEKFYQKPKIKKSIKQKT